MSPERKGKVKSEVLAFGKMLVAVLLCIVGMSARMDALVTDKVDVAAHGLRQVVSGLEEQQTRTYILLAHQQAELSLKMDTSYNVFTANLQLLGRKLDHVMHQQDQDTRTGYVRR